MRNTDFVAGLLLLGFSILLGEESLKLPFGTMRVPGIALLPLVLAVLLAVLSLALIFQGLRKAAGGEGLNLGHWKKVALCLGALLAFGFVFEWLGYVLSTVLLLAFLMRAVEPVKWRLVFVVAVSSSLATYIVFSLLGTPLPAGLVGF